MTPEQEDEIRSMVQGVEDRVRDVTDAVSIQTDILAPLLETIAGELIELKEEQRKIRLEIESKKSQSTLFQTGDQS